MFGPADIEITLTGTGAHQRKHRVGHYRLLTTLTDYTAFPTADIVQLYHQRWEIETSYLELKSSPDVPIAEFTGGHNGNLTHPPSGEDTGCGWPDPQFTGLAHRELDVSKTAVAEGL
ncbi:MAG: transposase family protein [Nocardia sp.]|uniref:hypothetical protein n=1 Tax=Nocardia sp. TaxID=1821 RepID=UPI0026355BE4|nr:hypothetical protein [Nocardia sp.]MCU1644513.1 transposase family protein [Nocardia sp.]